MTNEQGLNVQVMNEAGFTTMSEEFLISLDAREDSLAHAVDDRNYVSDFAVKHVPVGEHQYY